MRWPFMLGGMQLVRAVMLAAVIPIGAAAQTGTITGRVVDGSTLEPLSTVQVSIRGTTQGTISGADARFVIQNVRPGTHTVVAQRIGYQQQEVVVTVAAGGSVQLDLTMNPSVLSMQGIVVTGLVDPVEGVRSPITVNRLSREAMPVVAAGSAVQNLQGRVPGLTIARQGGQPGEDVSMMLRSPTSVTGSGAPLIVVDGVILGEGAGTSNIESLDIESMEVIKGAAAASLYGSRAAAGVISITTNRGRLLDIGETQFQVRTEIGRSSMLEGDPLPTHHQYLMNEAGTSYVDANGNPVDRTKRVAPAPAKAFMDNAYPGPIYDNLRNLYQGGGFFSQTVSMMQNGLDTNFAVSLNTLDESGTLEGNGGYERNSFRINLDHRFTESMNIGISAYHSRDWRDEVDASYFNMLMAPPDVDLRTKDDSGEYVRIPDPMVAYENPLWTQASRDSERRRVRTLGSANLRWNPRSWFSFSANASYDRNDSNMETYIPKGTPLSVTANLPADGSLRIENNLRDTWNAEGQVSFQRDFSGLNARTTFRGLLESDRYEESVASGTDFLVRGIPSLAVAANRNSQSDQWEVNAIGYLWDTALDYDGKYILTVLGRRDGSSLFGPDNRWHNYYRVAGAWRLAEEPWFNLPHVDEFKLSFARGTAGGRPSFAAQYETWAVTAAGVSKATLGNRRLRPEHTTENEVSLDMIVAGRTGIELTYAWQRTTDQLVDIPLPGYTGYTSQWSNIGSVVGSTIEASIESQLMSSGNFSWTTNFLFDRTKSRIDEWDIPCRNPIWRYWCDGVDMYDIYGSIYMTSVDQLSEHLGGVIGSRANEFQVNDDGWLVWVGAGNTYQDGIAKNLWGTSASIEGSTYQWGMPIFLRTDAGTIVRDRIGNAMPTNFGWVNNVRFGNFNFHAHLHAAIDADLASQTYRSLRLVDMAPEMDQAGKPEGLKKPTAYYVALEGGRGNLSNIQPAEYLKLRTLSVNYRLDSERLQSLGLPRMGMQSVSLGLVGRNLISLHGCECPDPEQATNLNSRLAQLATGEGAGYPNSRTVTAEITITF